MSHFEHIYNMVRSVPAALQHNEIYQRLIAAAGNERDPDIDLNVWEKSTVSIGEMNLLVDLNMADKFRYPGMDAKMTIKSGSLAKQKAKGPGKGSLTHTESYDETFYMENAIELVPNPVVAHNSGRVGLQVKKNDPAYKKILASLTGIAGKTLASPAVAVVGEKLSIRQDLRHLFLKGYLILMSYNLSVVSDVDDCEYEDITVDFREGINPEDKLKLLTTYPIVVEADHFTEEEIWVLAEMASDYPRKRYGETNIYNNINLPEDTMVVVSDRVGISLGSNPGYKSPETLWQTIVNIAVKFRAMEDLREVVRSFRGMPGLLRSISMMTGSDVYQLDYPSSYSIMLGVEPVWMRKSFITRNSGYYATSKCLVADLLLSKMMEMSVYNLIEEFGMLSSIGCPTGDLMSDEVAASFLHNCALKKESDDENELLTEWEAVRGVKIPLSFDGRLKRYVQAFGDTIRKGNTSGLRPQLLHALPFSQYRNTTWGSIRGWTVQGYKFEDVARKRIHINQAVKAFTWVMGKGKKLPKVGLNAFGERFLDDLSVEETEFISLADGDYEISLVKHSLEKQLLPRMDEYELGMYNFYSTSFPGVRCKVVYDVGGEQKVVVEEKLDKAYTSASIGLPQDGDYITPGGSTFRKLPEVPESGEDMEDEESPIDGEEIPDLDSGDKTKDPGHPKKKWGDEEEPEVEKASPTVEVRDKGMLKYSQHPRMVFKDGNLVEKEVNLKLGGTAKVKPVPFSETLNPESFRGYRLRTPGDGFCGMHAILEDLLLKGYITPQEGDGALASCLQMVGSESFHSVNEVAGLCNMLGHGLIVVELGGNVIHEFGVKGAHNNICIIQEMSHFDTFLPHSDGPDVYTGFKRIEGSYDPEGQLRALIAMQDLVDNEYFISTKIPYEFEKLRQKVDPAKFQGLIDKIPQEKREKLPLPKPTPLPFTGRGRGRNRGNKNQGYFRPNYRSNTWGGGDQPQSSGGHPHASGGRGRPNKGNQPRNNNQGGGSNQPGGGNGNQPNNGLGRNRWGEKPTGDDKNPKKPGGGGGGSGPSNSGPQNPPSNSGDSNIPRNGRR